MAANAGQPILELKDVHTFYGSIEALKGISIEVARRRDRDPDRSERRRQVDDPALDQRAQPPARGDDRLQGTGHHERVPAQRREDGHQPVARGPAALPAHERDREPRDGRLPAQRPQGDPGVDRPRLRALPEARRAQEPEGGDDVRRRAADVRDRSRADGPAEAAHARRAVDGPRADLRREDLRDHPGDQRAGDSDPARRAERADGARRRRVAAT